MPASPEFNLRFSERAREDIREISLWYRNELAGLDERFLLNFDATLTSLKSNPYAFQICFDSIRAQLLHRFPYRIYYFIQDNEINILGVIHTKRSPRFIRKRMKTN